MAWIDDDDDDDYPRTKASRTTPQLTTHRTLVKNLKMTILCTACMHACMKTFAITVIHGKLNI